MITGADFVGMFDQQRGEAFARAWSIVRRGSPMVPEDAHDVVMQAAMLAWQHLADYRGDGSLEAWFFRIVENCARSRSRSVREWQWHAVMDDMHPSMIESQTIEHLLVATEKREEMRRDVVRLPRILRQAVELHCYEGLSKRAAGVRVGLSVAAFKSRFNRAIKMLRERRGVQPKTRLTLAGSARDFVQQHRALR